MKKNCPYCNQRQIKQRLIFRNKLAQAFPTNIPIVPGHILISPVRCVEKYEDLTFDEQKAIFDLFVKLKKALKKSFKAKGFNIVWNEGKLAGQNVSHFHLHLVPRKDGDEGITEYEPRKFLYRPGSREESPQEELIAVSKKINKSI